MPWAGRKKNRYVGAGLLTLVFSAIMQGVTYASIHKINMIESLKSVEYPPPPPRAAGAVGGPQQKIPRFPSEFFVVM